MCGIVGVISKDTLKASSIKDMNDVIAHRGPDGEGFFFYGDVISDVDISKVESLAGKNINLAFCHKRLSIVDLTANGHQPMSFLDRYWITYNGEIYNYIELKEELIGLGYVFKSQTDTEVILAAYDAWGVECQNKFNGMWAFAIFDIEKEVIFISRDRFGIKPLYYYQDERKFIFSSEIKSLLENDDVITYPNIDKLKDYYNLGSQEDSKDTVFTNIYRFNNASYVVLDAKNFTDELSENTYWDYEVNSSSEIYKHEEALKYANQYYSLLKDAVRLRLRADVDVGSALSGGLDSSAIVYLINEIKKEDMKSYSIQTFSTVHHSDETKYCDESYYINLITDQLNIKSNQIEPNINEIPKLHSHVIKHWESPPDGTGMSGINTYALVSKSKVKVTLDGQGADEQQAGYIHYVINFLYHIPVLRLYPEFKKIKKIQGAHSSLVVGFIFSLIGKFFGKFISLKIIKFFTGRDMSIYTLTLNERLKLDCNSGLINLIHYSDSRSMLYSLESRMPFMDYRLVEFTAKIPSVYKIHNGWTKYFARLAFEGRLPDEIVWRKDKMGWPTPDKQWFEGELNEWLVSSVNKSKFIQDNIFKGILKNDLSNFSLKKSIRLLNISIWHKVFFKNRK